MEGEDGGEDAPSRLFGRLFGDFCSRWTFFSAALSSGRETQKRVSTGTTSAAPSSTAFWTMKSSLSPLGRAW